ncbi:DUF4157 domain-containing protein [Streptomyces sp. NPDC060184]|uniref:eCIS core domain-containing protein n=1 Tax=Streptomyces sp. NPDC060184 TaxID=3347064 RepID=UPI003665C83B
MSTEGEKVMHADRQRPVADPDRGRGLPRRAVGVPATAALQQAAPYAGGLSPAAVLSLQRTIGNAAVARLVERERHQHGADCGLGATVQRSTADRAVRGDAPDPVDAVTRTSGSPLRTDVRQRMENDYGGEDFSDVRVHVDRGSAEAVGAKAYTTHTRHIVFRSPADMDDHTMRHELQHVRQQRAGGVPSGISDPGDAWERDAERTATELGRRPGHVQRSTPREQDRTLSPGVAVQRMPSNRSRGEGERGRRGSDCRIEGVRGRARVDVSSSPGPARSPREEREPTVNNTWRNHGSAIGNQASVIRNQGTLTQNQGTVIHHATGPATDNTWWNHGSAIGNQASVIRNQGTITQNQGRVVRDRGAAGRSRRTVTDDRTGPATDNTWWNHDSTVGNQASVIRNRGSVTRNRGTFISDQGTVIHHGGLHTRNFSGSAVNSGEGDLFIGNAFNLFDQRPAGDPGWDHETNWEFNADMASSRGRRLIHGNSFTTGGAIRFNGGETGGGGIGYDGGDTGGRHVVNGGEGEVITGSSFDTGGTDITYGSGGSVFNGNYFNPRGGQVTGRNFHMSSGTEEFPHEGFLPPPTVPREEFRAQWPTVLNFDGAFSVEGNASMFIGNLFDAGRFGAWSSRPGGRRGERAADRTEDGGFPDPTHDDLFVGNTFSVRGGTITLSGGVYFRNAFSAERIIIRGNAVFVGGNSFHGEVRVENPDSVAQEIYVGEITGAHADSVTPL